MPGSMTCAIIKHKVIAKLFLFSFKPKKALLSNYLNYTTDIQYI